MTQEVGRHLFDTLYAMSEQQRSDVAVVPVVAVEDSVERRFPVKCGRKPSTRLEYPGNLSNNGQRVVVVPTIADLKDLRSLDLRMMTENILFLELAQFVVTPLPRSRCAVGELSLQRCGLFVCVIFSNSIKPSRPDARLTGRNQTTLCMKEVPEKR